MKKLIIATIFLATFSTAHATIPDFPMSFWGDVTINGVAAPEGSVVRVYDSANTLVGEVSLLESGVYGYTEPTKQKLVIGESVGPFTFTIQSSGLNGGSETAGLNTLVHATFISGETIEKDLPFTPEVVRTSSGGGGGGGGGGTKKVTNDFPIASLVSTSTIATSSDQKIVLQKQIIELLIKLIELLKVRM